MINNIEKLPQGWMISIIHQIKERREERGIFIAEEDGINDERVQNIALRIFHIVKELDL